MLDGRIGSFGGRLFLGERSTVRFFVDFLFQGIRTVGQVVMVTLPIFPIVGRACLGTTLSRATGTLPGFLFQRIGLVRISIQADAFTV